MFKFSNHECNETKALLKYSTVVRIAVDILLKMWIAHMWSENCTQWGYEIAQSL